VASIKPHQVTVTALTRCHISRFIWTNWKDYHIDTARCATSAE